MATSSDSKAASTPAAIRTALTALLDGVPASRRILRHLAAVEHELGIKTREMRFLFDAPLEQLVLIERQLAGLLGKTPPTALASLRARLIESIKDRERAEELAGRRAPISSFFVDHKLQVSEGGLTDFNQLAAEWKGVTPSPGAKKP